MNRAVPVVVGVVVTIAAVASGLGVDAGIASFVAPDEARLAQLDGGVVEATDATASSSSPTRAPVERPKTASVYIDGILRRNIFDAEFINTYAPSKGSDATSDPITDLDVKLIGTIVADPATFSSALIAENSGDARPAGYGMGDRIRDAEIISIERKKVALRRGNGLIEYLLVDDEGGTKTPSRSESSSLENDDDGIEKLGENKYAVSRDLLDKYVNDLGSISRLGRALLHRGSDGEFDGYRLSAIRRNTMPDKLGIRNGDVIHSVNGTDLNSVQGAMGAYQGMMNDNNFSFEVTRRGERVTLEYEVR
jgi:type II secretion system protein C